MRATLLLLYLASNVGLFAQTGSGIARHITWGVSDPAACSPLTGDVFFNTTSGTLKSCTSTDTWTVAGTGASGSLAIDATCPAGAPVGSICSVAQYIAPVLVSALPAAAAGNANVLRTVSDGQNTGDPCLAGSGTTFAICRSTGSAWAQISGSGSGGADASGYYYVSRSTNAPANAVNLGALTTGLLKISVSGSVATPSTATAGADYLIPAPPSIETSSPVTVLTVAKTYYNNSAGAMTFTLPTITGAMVTAGYCVTVANDTTRTGALTLQAPASTYIDWQGAYGTAAGTLVSTGALADGVTVCAKDTTHYKAFYISGAFTNS